MKGYLQATMFFDDCRGGKLYVYVAGGTTLATIYDPISGDPITNPVDIDVEGYASAFHGVDDFIYDITAKNYLGVTKLTREYIAIGGTSGGVGPQGPQGDKGDKGDKGDTGSAGTNGTDGTDGTNGVDGTDGISLVAIRVDDTTNTGKILYNKSDDPDNWLDAGDILPGGYGLTKVTADGNLDVLGNLISAGEGIEVTPATTLTITNTAPETFKSQVSQYSTTQAFLASLFVSGTGIDVSTTPDLNQLKISATGTAVGGFLWKGEWDVATAYSINNAIWYFDETQTPAINRLYIATANNQGINPYEDTTGLAWSTMMIIDTLGDQFVKVSATDSTPGYLSDKLVAGNNVTLEIVDVAGEKTYKIHSASADTTYPVYYQETVYKGWPLYVTNGSQPNLLYVAKADSAGSMPAMLIADADYTAGTTGTAITSGLITNLNTLGLDNGTKIYVGQGGGTTTIPPYEKAQIIGVVARGQANGDGSILFNVDTSYADKVTNSGVIGDAPTWTATGNIVTLSSCRIRLYTNNVYKGIPQAYTVPSSSLTIPANADTMVIAAYSAGTASYQLVDAWNFSSYNASNSIPIARFWYQDGALHSLSLGSTGNGAIEKLVLRQSQTEYYVRTGSVGLIPSTNSSRNVFITASNVWAGLTPVDVAAFNSVTNTLYQYVKTAGVWTKGLTTVFNNAQINDNAGLVTMDNSKYSVVWLYKSIGDAVEAFTVQHTTAYNTYAEAYAVGPRADVPFVLLSHCILCGRIIFQKSASTWVVEDAFGTTFGTSSVEEHNNLSGLNTGDYQHLTAAEKAEFDAIDTNYLSKTTSSAQTVAGAVSFSTQDIHPAGINVSQGSELIVQTADGRNQVLKTGPSMGSGSVVARNRLGGGGGAPLGWEWTNGESHQAMYLSREGQLEVKSASIPVTAVRTSSATSGFYNSLTLSHVTSGTTTADMAVSMEAKLRDATTISNHVLGHIDFKRRANGDLDTAANRQCNVEIWSNNTVGTDTMQMRIGADGLAATAASPSTSENSKVLATTEWVKDVAPQLSTGFSAGTTMVYRAYNATKSPNILYFEY